MSQHRPAGGSGFLGSSGDRILSPRLKIIVVVLFGGSVKCQLDAAIRIYSYQLGIMPERP